MTARRLVLVAAWLCALLVPRAGEPFVRAEEEALVLIGHPSLGLDRVELAELRNLYLGRTTMLSGRVAIPINYPPRSRWRQLFDRGVLGMGPDEVGRYWVDTRIRGGGRPPRSVPTPDIMVRVIAALRGSVGYVPAQLARSERVTVLRIQGLASP
jgi:hypothetical protein